MAVLVGIYLIQGDAFDIVRKGKTLWTGTWTLFRSPGMDRKHWEPLTSGEAATLFATPAMAARAGEEEGVAFARELQGDDGLEPMQWDDAPVPAAVSMRKTSAGGWC